MGANKICQVEYIEAVDAAMKPLNVLVVSRIDEECKRQITGVDPRINLIDTTDLWEATHIITEDTGGSPSDKQLDLLLAEAEIIYGRRPPPNVIRRAPKLKWFQTMLAGVDHFLSEDLIESPVLLTNMSGFHGGMVGEVALAMILMFAKRAPFCFENKLEKKWVRFDPMLLAGKTAGIIGLGHIGRNVARLCKAFGMNVIGTRRSAREGERARYVDRVVPVNRLEDLLSESDFVLLFLPSTGETDKLIGERELLSMKPSAYLLNLGRGSTVDEEGLIRALSEGWIAGAGLDAFSVEPLPPDSSLWELPNVILFPHVAGKTDHYERIINELFCKNLERYLAGKRLLNIVNKKRGY